MMVVFCLAVLTICLAWLLLHWCNQWPCIHKATLNGKIIRLALIGVGVGASVAAYGKHVWPKPAPTGTDAKIEELRTEIRTLLEPLGDNISRQKLLAKYPLGYVIFDVDYKNSVFPYESQAVLDRYEFDWRVVSLTEDAAGRIAVRFPDVRQKDGGIAMDHLLFYSPKRVGKFHALYTLGDVTILGEILAFRENRIVFLVGFEPTPDVVKTLPH
jgi:hypothetical protein